MLPALAWIIGDTNSWIGDTTGYATKVIFLFSDLLCCPDFWLKSMIEGYRAPFILWVGQLFVPFGILINDIKFSLLLLPFLATLATLFFTYGFLQKAFNNRIISLTGTLATASSPFLFGYSLGFWIEPLQITVISFLFHSLMNINNRSFYHSCSLFIIIVCISLLIKVSTAAYILIPAIVFFFRVIKKFNGSHFTKGDIPITIIGLLTLILTSIFYIINLKDIFEFASFSFASELYSIGISKIDYGVSKVSYGIFTPPSFSVFCAITVIAFFKNIFNKRLTDHLLWISLGQILLFIPLWIKSPNYDPRFILPNLMYFVTIFCWGLSKINSKKLMVFTSAMFVVQYIVIAGYSLNFIHLTPAHPMLKPMTTTPTKEVKEMNVIHELLENGNTVLLDLEPDIYLTDFELELLQKDWKTNWRNKCSDVNQLLDINMHQIDTSRINLQNVWLNLESIHPDFIITRPCRLNLQIECSELSKVDKYDAQTILTRIALMKKIDASGLYETIPPSEPLDLIIFRRISD